MPRSISLDPLLPAIHLPVRPGGEVIVRGWFYSSHDGSVVDAASTSWPIDAPGGPSVGAGGLFDLAAGGFEVVAADPVDHVVRLVASEGGAHRCAAMGVDAPCLLLRNSYLAHSRLLTVAGWRQSLHGEMRVELLQQPLAVDDAAAAPAAPSPGTWIAAALVVLTAWALAWLAYRRASSAEQRRLEQLLAKLRRTARHADPLLSPVLDPALSSMTRAVRERRLDPRSTAAQHLAQALERLDADLRARVAKRERQQQRDTALALASELEVALEAAAEAAQSA